MNCRADSTGTLEKRKAKLPTEKAESETPGGILINPVTSKVEDIFEAVWYHL